MGTEWLLDEILTGLQKLYPLSLDRTPAAEVLPGTAMAWLEAITTGRAWDRARDTARIRAAFTTLAGIRESWPAPRHFLDALPRVEQRAIGYEVKPATREEADAAMARCRAMLKDVPTFTPADTKREPTTTPEQRAQAERELADHYGKAGKMAAAGPDA